MISTRRDPREAAPSRLRNLLLICTVAYLAVAGTLIGKSFSTKGEAADLLARSKATEAQAASMAAQVQKASKLPAKPVANSISAISILQSELHQLAKKQGCTLVEFRSSTESVPYLTRFSKDTLEKGWNQIEAQATLRGPVQGVIATLASLGDMKIPFEYNSLELVRDEVNETGDAVVLGKVSLRVLTRGGS